MSICSKATRSRFVRVLQNRTIRTPRKSTVTSKATTPHNDIVEQRRYVVTSRVLRYSVHRSTRSVKRGCESTETRSSVPVYVVVLKADHPVLQGSLLPHNHAPSRTVFTHWHTTVQRPPDAMLNATTIHHTHKRTSRHVQRTSVRAARKRAVEIRVSGSTEEEPRFAADLPPPGSPLLPRVLITTFRQQREAS